MVITVSRSSECYRNYAVCVTLNMPHRFRYLQKCCLIMSCIVSELINFLVFLILTLVLNLCNKFFIVGWGSK